MSGRLRAFVVILFGGLALAACASDGTLEDVVPLPPDAVPLPRPAPKPSAALVVPAWQHLPEPVNALQLKQDEAKCTKLAKTTPGLGSPEIKFYLAFTKCMRSEGYEASS